MTTTKLRSVLASFLFTGDDVFKEISKLSGGEKCRINLLKLMLSKSNLLLLDEPTNHLDVESKDELKKAIKEFKGTVLLVCHEPEFYMDIVDDVWNIEDFTTKIV